VNQLECKVLVLGGGPGGYICAIRSGQLGLDTILIEADRVGGTCLNVGCIPSKALIHAADEFHKIASLDSSSALGIQAGKPKIDFGQTIAWKDGIVKRLNGGVAGLLRKAKVRSIQGIARIVDGKTVQVSGDDGEMRIKAENIVIATGSEPVELPFLPFGDKVISSTEALSLDSVPKKLAVVGGGYIGLEIGTAFAKLGSQVTVVESEDRILSQYDADLTSPVKASLEKLGVTLLLNTKAKGLAKAGLEIETPEGASQTIPADKILVTVGRRPSLARVGARELDLAMNGPFIRVDERGRTSMRGVYAIGDVTGEPMLAHRAMAQGEIAAEVIAGQNSVWDKVAMPAVCFTDPEIVTCGLSPDEAKSQGIDVKVGRFPFSANGRAMTMESTCGFIRVVSCDTDGAIVGIQAVGCGVSEMASSFSIALEMGACIEDVAKTIQAHPTLSEGLQEASLMLEGHALHI